MKQRKSRRSVRSRPGLCPGMCPGRRGFDYRTALKAVRPEVFVQYDGAVATSNGDPQRLPNTLFDERTHP